jgi:uncharacterized pyridoxamine 5'-phosphate oxidase family protein
MSETHALISRATCHSQVNHEKSFENKIYFVENNKLSFCKISKQNNVISNIKSKNETFLLVLIRGLNLLRRNWSRTSFALTNTSVQQSMPRNLSKFYIFWVIQKTISRKSMYVRAAV